MTLSGLAELFEEKASDEYAVGLWNRISEVYSHGPHWVMVQGGYPFVGRLVSHEQL